MKTDWQGGGRIRIKIMSDGGLGVHFNQLTSRGGRLQNDFKDCIKKYARDLRPDYQPYEVRLWVSHTGKERRIDVDNVAKACLDCLTGVAWFDDAQVRRLHVEKVPDEQDQVYMLARPLNEALDVETMIEELKGENLWD